MWNIFSHNRQTNNPSREAVEVCSQALPRLDDGCKNIQQSTCSSLQEASDDALIGDEAAEYKFDLHADQMIDDEEHSFACLPDNPVLIEMSYMQESRNIEENIFDLQVKGYQPVLAHPERYVYDHQESKRIQRFKDLVCIRQANFLSELGYYGSLEKQIAQDLVNRGVIDFRSSDIQHENRDKTLYHTLQNEDISKHFRKCNIKNAALFTCKT